MRILTVENTPTSGPLMNLYHPCIEQTLAYTFALNVKFRLFKFSVDKSLNKHNGGKSLRLIILKMQRIAVNRILEVVVVGFYLPSVFIELVNFRWCFIEKACLQFGLS